MSNSFLKEIIMKTKFVTSGLILASSLIAGTSFAADNVTLSREQVSAAYLQARAEGSLPAMGDAPVFYVKAVPSTMTRDAVTAEYVAAQKAGTLPALGDSQVVAEVKSEPSTLTRTAVRAEYVAARLAGTLPQVGERG
jgi:hypothetical protein